MKNILCYCEANNKTGFGHFSRIAELLRLLKKKNKNSNFFIYTQNKIDAKIFFKNYKILNTKKPLLKYCENNKNFYDLIILDPPYYENKISSDKKIFKKIFQIKNRKFKLLKLTDETYPSRQYCDFLINDYPQSKKFSRFYKKINFQMKLYLGINFFLYPFSIIKKYKNINKIYDILVVFGGSDRKNLSNKYFNFLKKLNLKKIFILNKNTFNKLKRFENKNNIIMKYSSREKFLKLLAQSHTYFSTPSNIMFEAYALKIKGHVVPIEKRQQIMGKSFENIGWVKCLPFYKKIKNNNLPELIDFNFKHRYEFKYNETLKKQKKLINILSS